MNTPKNKDNYKELKEKFYEKFYKPKGIEGWHIEGTIFDVWSFISQEIIPLVEKEKVKEIREKLEKKLIIRKDMLGHISEEIYRDDHCQAEYNSGIQTAIMILKEL